MSRSRRDQRSKRINSEIGRGDGLGWSLTGSPNGKRWAKKEVRRMERRIAKRLYAEASSNVIEKAQ